MSSKRNFDDFYDEYSDEDRSVLDDDFGNAETEEDDSGISKNLEDSSEDPATSSTDEDSWQEETDVSSVECENDTDGDQEPLRRRSKPDNQSVSEVFLTKASRQWSISEPPKRKIPQPNLLREQHGIGRPAARMQTINDAFQLLFTQETIDIIVTQTNRRARLTTVTWNEQNPNKKWQWKDTISQEIWAFIGLLVLGGVQRSQNENLNELWSTSNGRPIFRATMSKN